MARRRFNTKFAIWLVVGLLVAAGAALVLKAALQSSPQELEQRGDGYAMAGNLLAAHDCYVQAIARDHRRVSALIKDGDVLAKLTEQDPEHVGQDRLQYQRALGVDPKNREARQRILDGCVEAMRFGGSQPFIYNNVHDAAESLHEIDPSNLRAEAFCYIAPLAAWTHNIATPPAQISDNLSHLQALLAKAPQDPDIRYYLASVWVYKGKDQQRQGYDDEALKDFKLAVDTMRGGVKAAPESAAMHLYCALILGDVGRTITPNETPAQEAASITKHLDDMGAELAAARKYVKPADSIFLQVYRVSANLERMWDLKKGEAICHELLKIEPENQEGRLLLAEIASGDPSERDEVISVLRQPIGIIANIPWGSANVRANFEFQTNLSLEEYLLESYAVTPLDQRKQLLGQIKDLYANLSDHEGTDYRVLKLRGLIEELGGGDGAVKAVQTLESAQRLARQKGKGDLSLDWLLVEAYCHNHQTGPAKANLQQMIQVAPNNADFRIRLTELLLDDHDTSGADAQIAKLTQLAPNDSRVQNLLLQYYLALQQLETNPSQAKSDVEKIRQLYAKLPDAKPEEKWRKAQLALRLNDAATAQRFLEEIFKDDPTNFPVVEQLVSMYEQQHQRDKAIAVVKEAVNKCSPNGPIYAFKVMLAVLTGEKPEAIEKLQVDAINTITDAADRELKFYDHYRAEGNMAEALKHLAAAEKADPDNTQVEQTRFLLALSQGNFADADQYAHLLAQKDADHADGLIYQFQIAQARQDIAKEIDIAHNMTQSKPEFSMSWQLLGEAMQAKARRQNDLNSYDQAISDFGVALDKQSENEDALLGLIQCYLAEGKPDLARQYIDQGLKISANSPAFREQYVQFELVYGDPHAAVLYRRQDLDQNPQSPQAWLNLSQAYVDSVQYDIQHGQKDAAQQDLTAVRDTVNEALTHWPNEHTFYAVIEEAARISGDYASGEAALRAIAARDLEKKSARGSLMLAAFEASIGKPKDAEATLLGIRHRCDDDDLVQLELAQLYSGDGHLDDAIKALDPNSANARVHEEIARLLIASGKFEEADQILDHELSAATTAPSATTQQNNAAHRYDLRTPAQRQSAYLWLKGVIQDSLKHPSEAAALVKQALQIDPRNVEALQLASRLEVQQWPPDLKTAQANLTLARDLAPDNVAVRMALAEVDRRKGDMDSAVRELEQAMQTGSTNKQLRQTLVMFYSACRPPRWNDAERLLASSESMPQWKKDPDWLGMEARMWAQRGDQAKALAKVQEALALAPGNEVLLQTAADILMRAQKYSDVVNVCDQLLGTANGQKIPWIYQMRAESEHKLSRDDASAVDFAKCFALIRQTKSLPDMVKIMLGMSDALGPQAALAVVEPLIKNNNDVDVNQLRLVAAYLYLRARDGIHATAMVDAVTAQRDKFLPDQLEYALVVAGDICLQTGDADRAQAIYREVLSKWPDNISANNDLANILCDRVVPPHLPEALKLSERAAELTNPMDPDDPIVASILDTRGWVLVKDGQVDAGIACLQQALDHRNLVDAHYHLGQAYISKQMFDDAIRELQAAKQMIKDMQTNHQNYDVSLEDEIETAMSTAREQQAKIRAQGSP